MTNITIVTKHGYSYQTQAENLDEAKKLMQQHILSIESPTRWVAIAVSGIEILDAITTEEEGKE